MSLMCDNCDQWFHADCQGIGKTTFDILSHSKATWYCHQCNFPNYSTGLFASLDTLSDTSSILNFSYFCSTSQEASNNDDSINIGSPQASSSPMAPKQPRRKPPKIKSKPLPTRITVLNINCPSVVEKKLELKYLMDHTRHYCRYWILAQFFLIIIMKSLIQTLTPYLEKTAKTEKGEECFWP